MWLVIPANHEKHESTFLLLASLLFLLFTSCMLASYNLYIYSLQPQPQAMYTHRTEALRKRESRRSQRTLAEPGSQQHLNCTKRAQSGAKAGTHYQGSPDHETGSPPGQTLAEKHLQSCSALHHLSGT